MITDVKDKHSPRGEEREEALFFPYGGFFYVLIQVNKMPDYIGVGIFLVDTRGCIWYTLTSKSGKY